MKTKPALRLHIVGTGCPAPRADMFGSAFVLEIAGESILVDCGPATTYKMARMGLDPLAVSRVFFTHHHFDHNADFPCFVLTRWDQSRGNEPPLEVYGPPPTMAFTGALFGPSGAFAVDWQSRLEHPASHACHLQRKGVMPRPAPAIHARDISPGPVAGAKHWKAAAICVHHVEPTMASMAYRFETDRGAIVFAGDCADCKELREIAKGAGTLVMACTHFGSPPFPAAIADVITGTPQAAEIARQAGVRRVILTHMSPNFSKAGARERAVAAVARKFSGEIFCPEELTTVDL